MTSNLFRPKMFHIIHLSYLRANWTNSPSLHSSLLDSKQDIQYNYIWFLLSGTPDLTLFSLISNRVTISTYTFKYWKCVQRFSLPLGPLFMLFKWSNYDLAIRLVSTAISLLPISSAWRESWLQRMTAWVHFIFFLTRNSLRSTWNFFHLKEDISFFLDKLVSEDVLERSVR